MTWIVMLIVIVALWLLVIASVNSIHMALWVLLLVSAVAGSIWLVTWVFQGIRFAARMSTFEDVNGHNEYGQTPLIMAIEESDVKLARILLANGADPNMPDAEGITPLIHAVGLHDLTMTDMFLKRGAVVNDRILQMAADDGAVELRSMLEKHQRE